MWDIESSDAFSIIKAPRREVSWIFFGLIPVDSIKEIGIAEEKIGKDGESDKAFIKYLWSDSEEI